eukprot:1756837-Prymnesium_polylepis.2
MLNQIEQDVKIRTEVLYAAGAGCSLRQTCRSAGWVGSDLCRSTNDESEISVPPAPWPRSRVIIAFVFNT